MRQVFNSHISLIYYRKQFSTLFLWTPFLIEDTPFEVPMQFEGAVL